MKKVLKAILIILLILAYLFTMLVAIGVPSIVYLFSKNSIHEKKLVQIPGVDDAWLVISGASGFMGEVSLSWLTEKNELLFINDLIKMYAPRVSAMDFCAVNNGDGTFTIFWESFEATYVTSYTFSKPAEA